MLLLRITTVQYLVLQCIPVHYYYNCNTIRVLQQQYHYVLYEYYRGPHLRRGIFPFAVIFVLKEWRHQITRPEYSMTPWVKVRIHVPDDCFLFLSDILKMVFQQGFQIANNQDNLGLAARKATFVIFLDTILNILSRSTVVAIVFIKKKKNSVVSTTD